MSIASKLISKVKFLINRRSFSPLDYWEKRAQKYGESSVLNLSLNDEERKSLKDFQIKTIFPFLKMKLTGEEQTLLDFGCGPGRLSVELAQLTKCQVTAADPIEHLLQLAPTHPNVTYKKIINNIIPAQEKSFDIIWICFVLGGIVKKRDFAKSIQEINRVIKENGLLFLVENTTNKKDIISWKYMSKQKYMRMFKNFNLIHLHDFNHGGELFSIFSGRQSDV